MSNQEILEKAIRKALNGGWKQGIMWLDVILNNYEEYEKAEGQPALIFNRDFAKALWPGEMNEGDPAWQVRLQEMVIAEDPIKCLGENI